MNKYYCYNYNTAFHKIRGHTFTSSCRCISPPANFSRTHTHARAHMSHTHTCISTNVISLDHFGDYSSITPSVDILKSSMTARAVTVVLSWFCDVTTCQKRLYIDLSVAAVLYGVPYTVFVNDSNLKWWETIFPYHVISLIRRDVGFTPDTGIMSFNKADSWNIDRRQRRDRFHTGGLSIRAYFHVWFRNPAHVIVFTFTWCQSKRERTSDMQSASWQRHEVCKISTQLNAASRQQITRAAALFSNLTRKWRQCWSSNADAAKNGNGTWPCDVGPYVVSPDNGVTSTSREPLSMKRQRARQRSQQRDRN